MLPSFYRMRNPYAQSGKYEPALNGDEKDNMKRDKKGDTWRNIQEIFTEALFNRNKKFLRF